MRNNKRFKKYFILLWLIVFINSSLIGCVSIPDSVGQDPNDVPISLNVTETGTISNDIQIVDTGVGQYRFTSYTEQLQEAQRKYELQVPGFLPGTYGGFGMYPF